MTGPAPEDILQRPVRCHLCHQPMHYSTDERYVPELTIEVHGRGEDRVNFYVHLACWNERMGSDTPNKEQLALLDVINALRVVITALTHWHDIGELSQSNATDLLNLLAAAESKLQLP